MAIGCPPYATAVSASSDPDALVPPDARAAILRWYAAAGRPLAFRATGDPYAVLVAEVMAQQTQAARAAEAWTSWTARWPTASDLAAAPIAEVVRAWSGLGYNRRAVALHRAARAIVADHGGLVPDAVEALERLPGVGPYTARAVAAIAFGRPVGAVDTNTRRVLGRIAAGSRDALAPQRLQALADAVVPPGRDAAWAHALMDVGALLCSPRGPSCPACPAAPWCRYASGQRSEEGGRGPRRRTPSPAFASTARWLRGRVLEQARGADGDEWVPFGASIGVHRAAAVRQAVLALEVEGLLEAREVGGRIEARLPTTAPGRSAGSPVEDVPTELERQPGA